MGDVERRQQVEDNSYFDYQVQEAQDCHDRGLDFCYAHPKDVDRALEMLDKAIRMRENIFGKFHNDTSLSYFRKACILRDDKKDYISALIVARRELRISQHLLGGGTIDAPIVRDGSGKGWLSERIQWIQEVLFRQQTHISENDVAKYSSQLLKALEFERLGDQHVACKEWDLAITQYDCALALESSAFGRNILDMADIQVKIGDCYAGMGDFDAALEEYRNAQIKYQDQLGPSPHTMGGHLLNKCAVIYLKQKDFDAALGAHAKAYSIFERVLGKKHDLSVEALQDIRLVTVKEMEELRNMERLKKRDVKKKDKITRKQHEEVGAEVEDRSFF